MAKKSLKFSIGKLHQSVLTDPAWIGKGRGRHGKSILLTSIFSLVSTPSDQIYTSQSDLADLLSTTPRTIRKYLNFLEENEIIGTQRRGSPPLKIWIKKFPQDSPVYFSPSLLSDPAFSKDTFTLLRMYLLLYSHADEASGKCSLKVEKTLAKAYGSSRREVTRITKSLQDIGKISVETERFFVVTDQEKEEGYYYAKNYYMIPDRKEFYSKNRQVIETQQTRT